MRLAFCWTASAWDLGLFGVDGTCPWAALRLNSDSPFALKPFSSATGAGVHRRITRKRFIFRAHRYAAAAAACAAIHVFAADTASTRGASRSRSALAMPYL